MDAMVYANRLHTRPMMTAPITLTGRHFRFLLTTIIEQAAQTVGGEEANSDRDGCSKNCSAIAPFRFRDNVLRTVGTPSLGAGNPETEGKPAQSAFNVLFLHFEVPHVVVTHGSWVNNVHLIALLAQERNPLEWHVPIGDSGEAHGLCNGEGASPPREENRTCRRTEWIPLNL